MGPIDATPSGALPMFTKILVPTDGSEISLAGAMRAIPLARLSGAALCLLHVQEPYPYTGIGEASREGLQTYIADARAESAAAIGKIGDAARAQGLKVETIYAENDSAANGIVEATQTCGADLVVMGSHGRSGVAKIVLGSVAAEVLALSAVPVLIIKSAAADDGRSVA
jgi:nucleotide-binding universal stress UspA family protein